MEACKKTNKHAVVGHYWLPWYFHSNNCLVPIVLQNILLCVQQKKETTTNRFAQIEDE